MQYAEKSCTEPSQIKINSQFRKYGREVSPRSLSAMKLPPRTVIALLSSLLSHSPDFPTLFYMALDPDVLFSLSTLKRAYLDSNFKKYAPFLYIVPNQLIFCVDIASYETMLVNGFAEPDARRFVPSDIEFS